MRERRDGEASPATSHAGPKDYAVSVNPLFQLGRGKARGIFGEDEKDSPEIGTRGLSAVILEAIIRDGVMSRHLKPSTASSPASGAQK